MTNPLGKQAKYFLEDYQGLKRVIHIEGQASQNCAAADRYRTYYDDGSLKTKTDWSGRVTRYERDAQRRITKMIESEGTAEERITDTFYHSTFNKPERVEEPGQITHYDYFESGNNAGRLKSMQIQNIE